jgi:hypothetical protein
VRAGFVVVEAAAADDDEPNVASMVALPVATLCESDSKPEDDEERGAEVSA